MISLYFTERLQRLKYKFGNATHIIFILYILVLRNYLYHFQVYLVKVKSNLVTMKINLVSQSANEFGHIAFEIQWNYD